MLIKSAESAIAELVPLPEFRAPELLMSLSLNFLSSFVDNVIGVDEPIIVKDMRALST